MVGAVERVGKMKPQTVPGAAAMIDLVYRYTKNGDGSNSGYFLEHQDLAPILNNALSVLRRQPA